MDSGQFQLRPITSWYDCGMSLKLQKSVRLVKTWCCIFRKVKARRILIATTIIMNMKYWWKQISAFNSFRKHWCLDLMVFHQLSKFFKRFSPRFKIRSRNFEGMEAKDLVKEGKAEVLYPPYVFYNPVQEFNRDLTIAVISQFAKEKIRNSEQTLKSKQRNAECKRASFIKWS